jgi:secondary thiamine-phosphate synthase enzyme
MSPIPGGHGLILLTTRRIQVIDITDKIAEAGPFPDGFVWLSVPHTTAALILCEADAKMLADVERAAGGLLAPLEPFTHDKNDNPNAAAHLMSALMGSQLLLRSIVGALALGTHQRILFVELDGPRERQVQLARLPMAAAVPGAPDARG